MITPVHSSNLPPCKSSTIALVVVLVLWYSSKLFPFEFERIWYRDTFETFCWNFQDGSMDIASMLCEQKRYVEAEVVLQTLLRFRRVMNCREECDGFLLIKLGQLYYRQGNYSKSLVCLEKAINYGVPDLNFATEFYADVLHMVGRDVEAESQYRKALGLIRSYQIFPGCQWQNDANFSVALYSLGKFYLDKKRYSEAEPLLLKSQKLNRTLEETLTPQELMTFRPFPQIVILDIADLYRQQGRLGEALAALNSSKTIK